MDATSTAEVAVAARPARLRLSGGALLLFAGYYAGAKLGLGLTFSPNPISVLWPPNAVLLAALTIAAPRAWPLLLLAALPAHLLAELQGGVPLSMVVCWFASNASEAMIGAVCVRHFLNRRPLALDDVRQVCVFIAGAVLLAPFLSSFLDAAFVIANGWGQRDYAELWTTRFFSNMLATLTLAPPIVTLSHVSWRTVRETSAPRIGEGIVLALGLVAVSVLAFDVEPAVFSAGTMLFLPLPFLLWAALRFGPAGSSVAFGVVAFFTIWGAAHGLGPQGDSRTARRVILESGDGVEEKEPRQRFLTAYNESHELDMKGETAWIVVGMDDWPRPVPIVSARAAGCSTARRARKSASTAALSATSCTPFSRFSRTSQNELHSRNPDRQKLYHYAQIFISSQGKRDGL